MQIEKDQILTLAAVAILAGVFVFAIWMPGRQRSDQLDRRIDKARVELGMTPVARQELLALHSEVNRLQSVINGAQQYVPVDDEIAAVVRGINESLRIHGVTEQEMITRQSEYYADYAAIPVTIEFRSSFPAVFGTLRQIEQMPRLIRVDRLTVQGDADNPARPLEVQVQLSTFYSSQAGGNQG